jgi:hypothetical protein
MNFPVCYHVAKRGDNAVGLWLPYKSAGWCGIGRERENVFFDNAQSVGPIVLCDILSTRVCRQCHCSIERSLFAEGVRLGIGSLARTGTLGVHLPRQADQELQNRLDPTCKTAGSSMATKPQALPRPPMHWSPQPRACRRARTRRHENQRPPHTIRSSTATTSSPRKTLH